MTTQPQHRRPMSVEPTAEQLEREADELVARATVVVGALHRGQPWNQIMLAGEVAKACGCTLSWPSDGEPASVVPTAVLTEANWLRGVAAKLRQQRAGERAMATIALDRTLSEMRREADGLVDCGAA